MVLPWNGLIIEGPCIVHTGLCLHAPFISFSSFHACFFDLVIFTPILLFLPGLTIFNVAVIHHLMHVPESESSCSVDSIHYSYNIE